MRTIVKHMHAHLYGTRQVFTLLLLAIVVPITYGQDPTPTPPDDRGLGVQSATPTSNAQSAQQSREAKPELVLQTGYNNFFGATRLVFSPDGRLVATTTFRSSTIKLWETSTGRELRNLSTGKQSAMGMSPFIVFSRDSRLVAAAAGDSTVKVWDVTSGRELQTLTTAQGTMASAMGGVSFMAFAPDGRLVTISDSIRVWDVASGQELRSIQMQSLNAAAFLAAEGGAALSPDGNQLAAFDSEDKPRVRFWDLSNGREVRTVSLPDEDMQSAELAFVPDGRVLVAPIVENKLKLWDITGKDNAGNERSLGPAKEMQSSIKFSRDGRLLLFSERYTVKLLDVATGKELLTLNAPNSGVFAEQGKTFTAFSEDGKKMVTGGFDTPTILWETETGKQLLRMTGGTNMAYKVAFSGDGNTLFSGGRTRWDLRTGRGLRMSANSTASTFAIPSPDGRLQASFTPNSNVLRMLEAPSGREVHSMAPATGGGVIQRAAFSPDGTMVMTTYGVNDEQMHKPATFGF